VQEFDLSNPPFKNKKDKGGQIIGYKMKVSMKTG